MPPKSASVSEADLTRSLFIQMQGNNLGIVNSKAIINFIKENTEDLDYEKTHGMFKDTILTFALNNDLEQVALQILKIGERANIRHINESGDYALSIACKKAYKHAALAILQIGDSPCEPDDEGYTPLMHSCVNTEMIDVVEHIIRGRTECDIGYVNKHGESALSLTLQVGNPRALTLLLDSGESNPGIMDTTHKNVTLFEKMLFEEDIKSAKLIVEKTGLECNPLHTINTFGSTALMLAIPRYTDDNIGDYIDIIRALLRFAEETDNKTYVDLQSTEGYCAFDIIFEYAEQNDEPINPRVVKLFLDYYYKNDPNSQVFLRNVDNICQDVELYKALKHLYPSKASKRIIKNACREFGNAKASIRNATVKSRSPDMQTGRRIRTTRSTTKNLGHAFELLEAIRAPPPPEEAAFQVGDPRERGARQRKRRTGRGH